MQCCWYTVLLVHNVVVEWKVSQLKLCSVEVESGLVYISISILSINAMIVAAHLNYVLGPLAHIQCTPTC